MRKKLFSILLVIAVALAGCGQEAALQEAESSAVTAGANPGDVESEETLTERTEEEGPETGAEETEAEEFESAGSGETVPATAEAEDKKASGGKKETAKASGESKTAGTTGGSAETGSAGKNNAEKESSDKNSGGSKNQQERERPVSDKPAENKPADSKPSGGKGDAHTCTWDGGKVTAAATCGREGVRTYTCTGCGKTRTENVPQTSHNYVTETTAPTCAEAGKTRTYCSICGNVQSESSSGEAAGHSFVKKYGFGEGAPTCSSGSNWYMICSVCGEQGESGYDPATGHTPVTREEVHATYCHENGVMVTECSVCGLVLERHGYSGAEHTWAEESYEAFDPETHQVVIKTCIKCSRCGRLQ